jgi:hypothetical protein
VGGTAASAAEGPTFAEPGERRLHDLVEQARAGRGDEQARPGHLRTQFVAPPQVAVQRDERRLVQRHLSRLAELGVAHDDHAVLIVEIVAVEPDHLPNAHATHCKQADQRLVGRGLQRSQFPCCRHQSRDVLARIQVGHCPATGPPSRREQIEGRNLRAGIDRGQVSGEAPHDRQPRRPPGSASFGLSRPQQGEISRDE